jgi:hypothetical protein
MKASPRFSAQRLSALENSKILRIRAGNGAHRFIGIWCVVVEQRVFVRSWSVTADGWYQRFLKERRGAIQLGDSELPVRVVQVKSERLRDAIDRAYLEKYSTPGSIKYARDLGRAKSRATTTELVPLSSHR